MCVSEAVLQHSVEMHSHQDPLCAQLCRFLIAVLFPAYLRRGRPTRISALQQDSLLRDETGEQIQGLAAREHVRGRASNASRSEAAELPRGDADR